MNRQHILILGGGYGGMTTALRLSRRVHPQKTRITLVNASNMFVERIRNHERATNHPPQSHHIPAMLRGTGVTFVQGFVHAIRPEQKEVVIETPLAQTVMAYDQLVYALGSVVDRDRIVGVREHAYTMDMASSRTLAEKAPEVAAAGGKLLVIGGGLTGIETATEFAEAYPTLHVTLMTSGHFGAALSPKGETHLRRTFQRLGIRLIENKAVRSIEAHQVLTDGDPIAFDLCVWSGGFVGLPLARESGIAVNKRDQIVANEYLRSCSHPDIWAVGDSVALNAPSGEDYRMACATAIPMGANTADNIARTLAQKPLRPFNLGYILWCISLGRRDGLIQRVNLDDTLAPQVITGRPGAFIKEMVCRYAFTSIKLERIFDFYWWPGQKSANHQAAQKTQRANV